jgi:hypothetical protein
MRIIEQEIAKPQLRLWLVAQGIQVRFLERTALRVFGVKDAEKFQDREPGRLLVVKAMSSDRFIDPHFRAGTIFMVSGTS